jgi:hypothetical protein
VVIGLDGPLDENVEPRDLTVVIRIVRDACLYHQGREGLVDTVIERRRRNLVR